MAGANLRNNKASNCDSVHKKVESEKHFHLIYTNKEGHQLYFFRNNCWFKELHSSLSLVGISVLPLCNNSEVYLLQHCQS